jgi:hypothetical protein
MLKEGYSVEKIVRPNRKAILKRAKTANGYFTHGQEVGFEHWGILKQIKNSIYGEPVGMWFSEKDRPVNTSEYVMGIEIPLTYNDGIPNDMEVVYLPECMYLLFQGPKFDRDLLGESIEMLKDEINHFDIGDMNLKWIFDKAPIIEYDPLPERGCIFAYPVEKID